MSDILDRADAAAKSLDYAPDFAEEQQLMRQMIAEIKRLQAGAARGNAFVDDLMCNCNALRSRAQKAEAELERQAAYVARLEAAYLHLKEDQLYKSSPHDHYNDMISDEDVGLSREALERIKRGEKD